MSNHKGFTLIELVVVIVVIAILATLAALGTNKFLADSRDETRKSDIMTISTALEKYYQQNGEYPSCAAMTAPGATVVSATLKGLDPQALIAPGATAGTTNSIKCGSVLVIDGEDFYEYVGDSTPGCTGSGSCATYTLKYQGENDNQVIEAKALRQMVSVVVSDLAVTTPCYSEANLTWSGIDGASGYSLQYATNSGFTTGLTTTNAPINSAGITGLSTGTPYYIRVAPVGIGTGEWSNVATTTGGIAAPTFLWSTANQVTSASTSITFVWDAPSGANCSGFPTTYAIERASNAAFTTGLWTSGTISGTTSYNSGTLSKTTLYYFRLKAVTNGISSPWSATYTVRISET